MAKFKVIGTVAQTGDVGIAVYQHGGLAFVVIPREGMTDEMWWEALKTGIDQHLVDYDTIRLVTDVELNLDRDMPYNIRVSYVDEFEDTDEDVFELMPVTLY